mmetsp:Transcript_15321/g.33069  ORF Transcript_15321/g.33069 Transcript_15321/m.33069 type:complete len:319 (-) Transcript_15321:1724-2680(-)
MEAPPVGGSVTVDETPVDTSATMSMADLQKLVASLASGQAGLLQALQTQADTHARQLAETRAQHELFFSVQQARIAELENSSHSVDERHNKDLRTVLEREKEQYLNDKDYSSLIDSGFKLTPEIQETYKPHLFSLYGDQCYDKLVAMGKKASAEEYTILHCTTYYLSVAIAALTTEFVDNIEDQSDPSCILLQKIVRTLKECESLYRRRLAFVRIINGDTENDPQFAEFLRSEIYGQASVEALGSEDITVWARRFNEAKGRSTLAQGAKQAAQKGLSKGFSLPILKPKSDQKTDHRGKGTKKVSFPQAEEGESPSAAK